MKRIVCVIISIAVAAWSLVLPLAVSAADNGPVASVIVYAEGSSVTLDGSYPYLLDDGTRADDGELGSTAVAHFDDSTGTLTLQGYHFGAITTPTSPKKDLTLKLIGDNFITSNAQIGLQNNCRGNLAITANEEANLTIAVSRSGNANGIACGWYTGDDSDLTIKGYANISISVESNDSEVRGIYHNGSGQLLILDHASIDIHTKTPYGSGISSSSVYVGGTAVIHTTGNITLDSSDPANVNSVAFYNMSNVYLEKAGVLTLKWTGSGKAFNYQARVYYEAIDFHVAASANQAVYTYRVLGDVNCDGYVDMDDVIEILGYISGREEWCAQQIINGDVDGSSEVDSVDALLILKYVIGVVDVFPV